MATVELAQDTELGRKVAIKRLFASLADDDVLQERFFREARMAAALSHPNLVAVYDAGEDNDLPYIVMEYVPGETPAKLMKREGPATRRVAARAAGLRMNRGAGVGRGLFGLAERDALAGERELDFLPRLVDPPLDRGEGDLERVGDLRVREPDDVAEQ
jgi:Protein kinase domain